MVWLSVFGVFNVYTDVDACVCIRWLYGHRKRLCTGSWPGKQSLAAPGTRTRVSIASGFSVGRCTSWAIPALVCHQQRSNFVPRQIWDTVLVCCLSSDSSLSLSDYSMYSNSLMAAVKGREKQLYGSWLGHFCCWSRPNSFSSEDTAAVFNSISKAKVHHLNLDK